MSYARNLLSLLSLALLLILTGFLVTTASVGASNLGSAKPSSLLGSPEPSSTPSTETATVTASPTTTATSTLTATETLTTTATALTSPTITTTPTVTPTPTSTGAACATGWSVLPNSPAGLGILALAHDDVWVGGTSCGAFCNPRIGHYNGTDWTYYTPIGGGRSGSSYGGLAGTASTDVWAVGVGSCGVSGCFFPIIEYWDGTDWTAIPCSNCTYNPTLALYDVTAIGTGEMIAVGALYDNSGSPSETTGVVHCTVSDGCTLEAPISATRSVLLGVSAQGPNVAWAVGWITDSTHPLALQWNGSTWTSIQTPEIGQLWDVATVASDVAWAVGDHGTIYWNGTNWIQGRTGFGGYSISARNAADIWTVGYTSSHWDGISWTDIATPASIFSVSVDPLGDAWSSGNLGAEHGAYVSHYQNPQRYSDITPVDTFYNYIQCLSCEGVINGYPCGGPGEPCLPPENRPYFRSANSVTRGQLAKIVSSSAGFNDDPGQQVYEDVAPGSPFYDFVQRLSNRGIIAGYPCGEPGEPCVPPDNRPYFRPSGEATRGQTAKIVSEAAQFSDQHTSQVFQDVPLTSTFYPWIARLAARSIINGYPCGGAGEPCITPDNRPYFRPAATVSRGQTTKINANTFSPDCTAGPTAK